ncbi:MAG: heme ABC exporter ATP-binding protein CcmA [Rhodospirillales bacterium]|nr:MAG: heme ABC exporter ATP-binding protein CcmA [Rhodospirillales bacterium]
MSVFAGHRLTCIRGQRVVFRDLSFEVNAGGLLLLVGANGSGKTSLLRLMAGLLAPAAGVICWDGDDVRRDAETFRGVMRYVGHLDAVKPALTVAEHLRFWAALQIAPGSPAQPEVTTALEAFGIAHLAELPGRFLSAGQRRRLALARLLLVPARLWLLDEPRTALDTAAVARLDAAIADHRRTGGVVVLSSHAGERPPEATVLNLDDFAAAATEAWGWREAW